MSKMSSYPNGFRNGVSIKNVPILPKNPQGKVWWVSNSGVLMEGEVAGSDGNSGDFYHPFGTIDYAIGQCVAGRGDTIYVKPGHVEDISAAAAVDFDVDGVTCIGLGRGSKMAEFNFSDSGGYVEVAADAVRIENMRFHADVNNVSNGLFFASTASYGEVRGCKFTVENAGTDEFTSGAIYLSGADYTKIVDCDFDQGLGGAARAIRLQNDCIGTLIKGCYMIGDYSTAAIAGQTALSTNVAIEDNIILNGYSNGIGTEPAIEMIASTTGHVINNHFFCNVATIAAQTVADTMIFANNWAGEDVGAAAGNVLRTAAVSVTASADG